MTRRRLHAAECALVHCWLLLQAWKREVVGKHPRGLPKEYEEGFEVLEAEGGAGWDLLCKVRQRQNRQWHTMHSMHVSL